MAPGPNDTAGPGPDARPDRDARTNAATAASAASARALSAQAVSFYFRAPAKAFFRTRVDYLAYARTVHAASSAPPSPSSRASYSRQLWQWLGATPPGVLTSAVRLQGWRVVPHHILPPLLANIGVGAVLYTSYLQILARINKTTTTTTTTTRVSPPSATFAAGFGAGALQSVVAAPLDALQARFDYRDVASSDARRPRSMWVFAADKLREIGVWGVFAGWGLSFAKDSLGSAVFFTTFEYIKAQAYYRFVTWYYGGLRHDIVDKLAMKRPSHTHASPNTASKTITPHYAIQPVFLLCAGVSASFAQQVIVHPLSHFQSKHWDRLEALDAKAALYRKSHSPSHPRRRRKMLRAYYHAYQKSWAACLADAAAIPQSPLRWLYRGFWSTALRQVPSTSAGLIIFELIRRKYGLGSQHLSITKDGYDILLA